jgi:AAA15 family ATPase/GTPase
MKAVKSFVFREKVLYLQEFYKNKDFMLLKIELENFFSIKEMVRLDFRAANINTNLSRELGNNVIDWHGTKVLKTLGLFGPNASGKSNILKAINFCCRMILESHQHNEGVVFNFQPFKFDGYADKPSRFLIDFVCDDIEYEYSFALTRTEILEESLYHFPNGRKAKIYTREKGKYTFAEGAMPRPKDVVVNTSKKNLFLSRASSMNRELAKKLYRYFMNTFLLGMVGLNDQSIEELFRKYKNLILKALSICDSDISNIEYEKQMVTIPVTSGVEQGGGISVAMQQVEQMRFKTYHFLSPKISFDLVTEESNGTRQLFGILLRLLDVVKENKSVMIDEFDMSLHTRLADFILDLIHAAPKSQLLFTSHNTNLLDIKRLRKDQIVFVNKKKDGSSDVYTLFDYKDFRDNMDAEKGYLQGRFDAVPFVESSVDSLKQLMED